MAFPTDWMPCPDVYAFKSRKAARKFARKKYGKELDNVGCAAGVTLNVEDGNGTTVCLVVVECKDGTDASQKMALLAHECVHVVWSWAWCMGETKPGEEWAAYAVQSTMLTCLKQLGGAEWLR